MNLFGEQVTAFLEVFHGDEENILCSMFSGAIKCDLQKNVGNMSQPWGIWSNALPVLYRTLPLPRCYHVHLVQADRDTRALYKMSSWPT